ncbi:MAG: hypothetical protein JO043_13120 [Candidatus Eremiobacteraeota bacterium]|nr:hypothetical protein [Candidatus Eremiobacteraeota bacterium]
MSVTEIEDTKKPLLVVTGSSAGGIDALNRFAAGLPNELFGSVVIGQHLAPSHESHLANIIGQRSPLPIKVVESRETLEPSTVYVIPPNRDVQIADGMVRVFEGQRAGPKPSIDQLFESAAESYRDRVVAIILSGLGSDGLAGARVVKEQGGTVIIQDPATASHPSMPLAIPPTLVDLSAAPEHIGSVLAELVRGAASPEAASEQKTLRQLLTQLRDRTGIDFQQYKTPTIMRRLSRLMVATGVDSLADYVRYLQAHPEAYQRLASAFLIKVTEFFRDGALFEWVRDNVLPQLISEAAAGSGEVRIWSAGASTGEEAYSLAMLCADLMREDVERVNIRIFATDIDDEAIAFARRGVYSKEALRHIPPTWVERYFTRDGDTYEVTNRIRNMTVFGQHDLGQRAPFPRIDLCMCRNVLIYFTRELQQRALQLFAFSLRRGGYLVLGKAESTSPLPDYFRAANPSLRVYQRHGERVLIPPKRLRDATPPLAEMRSGGKTPGVFPPAQLPREGRPGPNEIMGGIMANATTGLVVVDRRYDIVSINAAARALLQIHGIGIGEDLIHLTTAVDTVQLRNLVDVAFRNEAETAVEFSSKDGDGVERWLQISCHRGYQGGSRAELVGLVISDVTPVVGERKRLEIQKEEQQRQLEAVSARMKELAERQKSLLSANDELTSANNELRSTNEQLLIGAEEVASSNEEIETLNEEMQATNEELETLNEELQATVEELNTTNDELESRSAELERVALAREATLYQMNAERDAMSRALEEFAGPVAIFDESGLRLYVSAALEGRLPEEGDWWRQGGTITMSHGDGQLEATPRRLATEPPMILVSFRPLG